MTKGAPRYSKQDKFRDPRTGGRGNCMQYAVAGLLNLPPAQVPNFIEAVIEHKSPEAEMQDFFNQKGFYLVEIDFSEKLELDCLHLAVGPAPRGCHHMVVMEGDRLVWDPHPSDAGLTTIERVFVPVPFDVSQKL